MKVVLLVLFVVALVPFHSEAASGALSARPTGISSGPLVTVSPASPFTSCHDDIGTPNLSIDGPTGPRVNAEAEAQLATAPNGHLVGAWIQDNGVGLVVGSSQDGGVTWQTVPLPFTQCVPGGLDNQQSADPWVSIGPDGTDYVVGIGLRYTKNAQGLDVTTREGIVAAISTDSGRSWHNVQSIQALDETGQELRVADKPSVTADPGHPGVAYAVWSQSAGVNAPGETWLAETTDGGISWGIPRVIVRVTKPQDSTTDNMILADPRNGRLYDIFDLLHRMLPHRTCTGTGRRRRCAIIPFRETVTIEDVTSSDRGATWSASRQVARTRSVGIPQKLAGDLRLVPLFDAAIDPVRGTLYVVWPDGRFSHGHSDEIALASSSDGRRWSRPTQVSAAQPSFLPVVAVNAMGMVGLTYYSFPNPTSATYRNAADDWFRYSAAGGKHFGKVTRIGGPFELAAAPGSRIGDYEGLATAGRVFHPFFVGTNRSPRNPTNVLTRSIRP